VRTVAAPDVRERSWRVRVLIFAASAVIAAALAVVVAVHHRLGAGAPLLAFAAVEAWRARSVYRRRPSGDYDEQVERAAVRRRMRTSALVSTAAAIGELVIAGFANSAALWWLGAALLLASALSWVSVLWLLPRAAAGSSR
jgi:uncharacterized membrane protein